MAEEMLRTRAHPNANDYTDAPSAWQEKSFERSNLCEQRSTPLLAGKEQTPARRFRRFPSWPVERRPLPELARRPGLRPVSFEAALPRASRAANRPATPVDWCTIGQSFWFQGG